jgi:hypothetical protein
MVTLLVLLTLLVMILAFFAKKGFLAWRMHAREGDVHRLQAAYCTMNDGGTKRKKYRFGKKA